MQGHTDAVNKLFQSFVWKQKNALKKNEYSIVIFLPGTPSQLSIKVINIFFHRRSTLYFLSFFDPFLNSLLNTLIHFFNIIAKYLTDKRTLLKPSCHIPFMHVFFWNYMYFWTVYLVCSIQAKLIENAMQRGQCMHKR